VEAAGVIAGFGERFGEGAIEAGVETVAAGEPSALGDGVDGQAHEGILKLGARKVSGEFEHPASEGEEFDRGSVVGGRVLKFGLKSCDTSRQSIAL
jgi:hypothetical protein